MKTTFLPLLSFLLVASLISREAGASTPLTADETLTSQTAPATSETAPAIGTESAEIQPGPAVIVGRNVNIRAQATIHSEVVTQLQDGDPVTVEEVILRTENKDKDPARWAKISYPASASVWVHSLYVDSATKTVKPKKLNVRSGPGENYTIVGSLKAGDAVTATGSKGDWIAIEPPTGATAFVAAKLLHQVIASPSTTLAATNETFTPTEVAPETEIASGAETSEPEAGIMGTTTESTTATEGAVEATGESTETTSATSMESLPTVAETPEEQLPPEEPPPPRVVQREGIVRSFTSIQAPSDFKLVSLQNGKTINYLYTTSTNLDLNRYVGLHIIASGEEWLDRRWPNMPVLTLQKIYLVD